MKVVLIIPALAALVGIAAGWFLPNFLSPRRATQILTGAVVLTSAAILAALAQVAMAGASEIPVVADTVGWCRALYHGQHGASPVVGLLAAVALGLGLLGMAMHWRHIRRVHAEFAGVTGIEIVAAEGPVAFAVPGHPGGVVVGADLLDQLDPDRQSAVLAHEHAHLELHHHLYVHAAEICAGGLPMLRPLSSRVRFMTERWADEVAADRLGSRRLLAETIAQVAMMPDPPLHHGLGFGGNQTLSRVQALLHPTSASPMAALPVVGTVIAVVLTGSLIQLHHLAAFFSHICPI